jgi:hypothetical protein
LVNSKIQAFFSILNPKRYEQANKSALKSGRKVEEICSELEVSSITFCEWNQRNGGIEASKFN